MVIMNTFLNATNSVFSFVFVKHLKITWLITSIIGLLFSMISGANPSTILLWVISGLSAGITIAEKWGLVLTVLRQKTLSLLTLVGKVMSGGNGLVPALFLNGAILFIGGFFYGGENGLHIAAIGVVLIIGGILAIAKAPTEVIHEKIEKKFFK
jgi:hypothetical protein